MALRCRIVLERAQGKTNTEAARCLKACLPTVGKWRARFGRLRLAGLADAPHPGQPRRITDAMVEKVITLTLESKPQDATHWSTRTMAKKSGLAQNAIHRIRTTFGLKPHLQETFKLSTDPFFVEKLRDVVGSISILLNKPAPQCSV